MADQLLPAISQAEAYHNGQFTLIRNSKTENAVELAKHHPDVSEHICEVPDFPAFLDATTGAMRGSKVIVAVGDSRTANFSNWPRIFAITQPRDRDVVVLNLADWNCCSEDHVAIIEYLLEWIGQCAARNVSIILFGELVDLHRKFNCYTKFMDNLFPQPFTDGEEQLSTHRYGSELAHLHDQVPDGLNGAALWIAERIVAIARLMDKICVEANAEFFAILEPNAYPDSSPGYLSALYRAYEEGAPPDLDFGAWCKMRSYARDPSEYFSQDLRPLLERLRALWHAQQRRSTHGIYADLSDLFFAVDGCCFNPVFDALHYNGSGVERIAGALFELLQRRACDGGDQGKMTRKKRTISSKER